MSAKLSQFTQKAIFVIEKAQNDEIPDGLVQEEVWSENTFVSS